MGYKGSACFALIYVLGTIYGSVASSADAEESELLFSNALTDVLTPTRLKQPIADVPASVTVIRRGTIKKLGIRTVPEALRLVPGMMVGQASGNEYRIGYHGTNGLIPRRMQVLIDGVSIYRTGYAQVGWSEIPVNIEDIDRIEVTRSPSAATYGANSFFGVINIITQHPGDTQGLRAQAFAGSLATLDAMASYSGTAGNTAYRFSLSHQQDSGYDKNRFDEERRDSTKVDRFHYRSITEISSSSSIEVLFNSVKGELESEFFSPEQLSFPDYEFWDNYLKTEWSQHLSEQHHIQIKAYVSEYDRDRRWQSDTRTYNLSDELRQLQAVNSECAVSIAFNPDPSNPPGVCASHPELTQAVYDKIAEIGVDSITRGNANEDITERQFDVEFQDTFIFSPGLRLVSGIGFRRDEVDSETFLHGKVARNSSRIFGNLEYAFVKNLTINLGGMWENEESHTSGFEFSPRGAINYHVNNNHTVRFVLSKAKRTPDMLEFDRDWNYTLSGIDPLYEGQDSRLYFYRAQAQGDLVAEEIFSKEISYYLNYPEYNLALDFKVFEEKLTRLISEKLQFLDYNPTNNNSALLRGAEFELNYKYNEFVDGGLTYAYLDNESTSFFEKSLHAQHSGSLWTSLHFSGDWIGSFAYYGTDFYSGFPYNRFDLVVSKSTMLASKYKLGAQFVIRHFRDDSGFIVSENLSVENKYDKQTHFYFGIDFSM